MATGFRMNNGVDLDQVFAARVAPAIGNVGFRRNDGVDLAQLFQPGNSGIVTGFRRSDGVDLGSLFSNSAAQPVNFSGHMFNTPPGLGTGTISLTFQSDGSIVFSNGSSTWYYPNTGGIGSSYDVNFSGSISGAGASLTGTYSTWLDLSTSKSVGAQATMGGGDSQRSGSGTISAQVRRKSDGVVVATGSFTFTVTSGGSPA